MSHANGSNGRRAGLVVAALGVVYGDIGTSPLYAFRESLATESGIGVTDSNVVGILSLIIWSLLIIITIKYVTILLRADNHGEGGILALATLMSDRPGGRWPRLFLLGIFGTALLYGDGAITPAISVLSAVEGLTVATPAFEPFVIPISVFILATLFSVQWRGTKEIGQVFGVVMLVWFGVLAVLGMGHIADSPEVLMAFDPRQGVAYLAGNGWAAFRSLGAIFLVVTGGEALYADMGHFGARPIRSGWLWVVLPALLLTYLGQGAFLMASPEAVDNPFFRMAPASALIPLVVIATAATVIASQALISGAFSLTMQAIQLDYLPRMRLRHTSSDERGQVYLPAINWALMAACIGLVLSFETSSALAAAYGVAVTSTMVITTLLLSVVLVERFRWTRIQAAGLAIPLLIVELAFFGANILKVPAGGWFPLVVAGAVFFVMTTWRAGRNLARTLTRRAQIPLEKVFRTWNKDPVTRVPGTAVYMFPDPYVMPPALLSNIRANHVLHEDVWLVAVEVVDSPRVPPAARYEVITELPHGFVQIIMRFGFNERADVVRALSELDDPIFIPEDTVFIVGRETIRSTARPFTLSRLRERLFTLMHRNAFDAARYYELPPQRVIEIGRIVEI
ncbi:MAG TPA: potassium transporter Kup [Acidimicrobiia bacterium]|nr:potassium transporter Kup [Acidimicrobiia bacterium]